MKKQTRTQLLQAHIDQVGLEQKFLIIFKKDGFYIATDGDRSPDDVFCYDLVHLGRNYRRSRAVLDRFIRDYLSRKQKAEEKRRAIEQKPMEMRRDNRMCKDDKCPMAVHCWRHTYAGRKPDRYQKYGDYKRGNREQCDHFVESWTG